MSETSAAPTVSSALVTAQERVGFARIGAATRRWVHAQRVPLALFVSTRIVLLVVGVLFIAIVPDGSSPTALARLTTHFDAGFFLSIAQNGYPLPPANGWLAPWAFLPLYPALVSLVHWPLIWLGNASFLVAGLLVSNGAGLASCVLLRRLLLPYGERLANRALLFLLLFPTTIFLSVPYSESLFLLLSLAAFVLAQRRSWVLAGLAIGLAFLTRSQGALLLVACAPLLFTATPSWVGRIRNTAALVAGPLFALGGYALSAHAATGFWLPFEASEQLAWARRLTPPIYPLIRYIIAPDVASGYDFRIVNFTVACVALALVVPVWRRFGAHWGLWLALSALLPLSSSGHYFFSFTRYMLVVFPLMAGLAALTGNGRWGRLGGIALLVVGAALALLWVALYIGASPLAI